MTITVGQIVDDLTRPMECIEATVDTLKSGDLATEITGIVTAFCATQSVVERAVALGANLLITHEGNFYSHHDPIDLIKEDSVYLNKQKFIEDSGIAIYRFHDYWHRYKPDGIMVGLVQALEWQSYVVEQQAAAAILTIPAMTAIKAAHYIKKMLGISYVRVAGDLSFKCRRVGILVGYRGGGMMAIPLFENEKLDLIVAGEGPEWETPEYVRDAVHQGSQKALIMLGHAESEVPGMKYLAEMLAERYSSIPCSFIAEHPIYHIV